MRHYPIQKIATVLEDLEGGGAERNLTNLMNQLVDKGMEIDLVLVKMEGVFINELSPKINLVNLKAKSVYFSLLPLVKYFKNNKPSIILSSLDLMNMITLLAVRIAGKNTKSIIRVANMVSIQIRNPLKKTTEKIFMKYIYPWADHIIAVSKGVAQDLSQYAGISQDKITVIYNPVITKDLYIKMEEKPDHIWIINNHNNIILAVGRLTQQKNFPNLVRAFQIVREQIDAKLILLGEGELRGELESLAAKLGIKDHVSLPGFVPNPYTYMKRASVFVLSSDYEGLPTVLIEAMACGCPVVSTDCLSGPNEILDGGKYGKLVPVKNAELLAQAVLDTLDGEPKSVSPSWLNQFTAEYSTNNFLKLLDKRV